MDWSTELPRSLAWILGAFLLCLVLGFLIGLLLCKRTRFGRQFWRLAGPYFTPNRRDRASWKPVLTVIGLLALVVLDVRITVLISNNNNALGTALQNLDAPTFWRTLITFAFIASVSIAFTLLQFYVSQLQIIRWRQWTNEQVLTDWLAGTAFYRARYINDPIDNPEQRIQADVTNFASVSQGLVTGTISAMLNLVAFTAILWRLSGPLSIFGTQVPRAMVFAAYIYVIIVSVIAFRIGRPLIRLSFLQERLSASYRYALIRVRDNSEAVAFYGGEGVEERGLNTRFSAVIANAWAIVFRSLKFNGFNFIADNAAFAVPYLIQAQRFFSRQITLGDLSQSIDAFGQVQGSLSFFRNAYDTFAGYRATLDRLTGLLDADQEARALPVPLRTAPRSGLEVEGLDVFMPSGQPLVNRLDLTVEPGDWLLVRGRSGSGKTTLLRSLAGLWPYVRGVVSRPQGHVIFCAQQPYLPLGTLRSAITYPAPEEVVPDAAVRQALVDVQLGYLGDHLDEPRDWMATLSPGERQRLSFGRVLLLAPSLVFFDESTSALDEGMEHALYALVRERLPHAAVVSVGHRSSLGASHQRELVLLGNGAWSTGSLAAEPSR